MGESYFKVLMGVKMKLITYVRMGKVCFGAFKGSGIIDLTGRFDLNVKIS